MLWIGIGVTLVAAIVVMTVILSKRPADELGSVSAQWVPDLPMSFDHLR